MKNAIGLLRQYLPKDGPQPRYFTWGLSATSVAPECQDLNG
jgi:hypothetical protein